MLRRIFKILVLVAGITSTLVAVVAGVTILRWDGEVTERFRTHRWNFPSKIYSDSTLIYPGLDLAQSGFFERLREQGYQRVDGSPSRRGDYRVEPDGACLLHLRQRSATDDQGWLLRLKIRSGVLNEIRDVATGDEVFTVEIEPAIITGLYENIWEERRLVTLADVSPLLVQAILDTEDQRFYKHHGVDLFGILRAIWVNLRSGQMTQGGSTLTQQLMKNFFLSNERNLRRKLREAVMAIIVERRFSKQEILENYLNEIYLGQRGAQGIFGVWEASQFYFAKTPDTLTVAEMALLAGLIRGPNLYSPFRDQARAIERRNVVLALMHAERHIDDATYEAARNEPLRVSTAMTRAKDAPYFVDFVRQELADLYPTDLLTSEGLRIYTSLDLHLQYQAEQALQDGLAALEKRHPRLQADTPEEQLQGCLLAIQPQTGAIKAMMGGRNYRSTQFNRCTQALRQPGSVFKPFVYAAALENTRHTTTPITPSTRIDDEPFTWEYDGRTWTPSNYGNRYHGNVTVREALEQSLNAATARLAYQIGLPAVLDVAQQMGISSPLPRYPAAILGAVEVSPFEVAQAYSVFVNGGLRAAPLSIKRVLDRSGVPLERKAVEVVPALPADTAYLVTHMLEGVVDRGTAQGARSMGFKRTAAGKTGTTNDYRDAWFVGFTPELLAVVWVGFDERRPLNLSGASAALPIWVDFMKRATAGLPATDFAMPPGIRIVTIDPESGGIATANCPHVISEAYYSTSAPNEPCPLHGSGTEFDNISSSELRALTGAG